MIRRIECVDELDALSLEASVKDVVERMQLDDCTVDIQYGISSECETDEDGNLQSTVHYTAMVIGRDSQ
ncbi:hypothetical protein [Megasphaera vaginalis (ex Bordigoni et al. 2020)]|uniref:hypothetical protein n=1 Tax=Megasphaera vaginalis (ex Bordigoni et al. 2020) TaxID=2045301 RepID=UPI000C7A8764|nr:hypothetical protein [Megasphaera vaginalis (ex Bordigoni et al. 2020)]